MKEKIIFLFHLLFLCTSFQSQTLLRGISNWNTSEIRAYRVLDELSEAEVEIGRSKVDSNQIFEFKIDSQEIEKVILRGANYYSWLYIEPQKHL